MQSSHSMKAIFEQQPGMAFYKSLDHVYSISSHYTAKLCGYKNADEFSGRNDYELRCAAIESADVFRAEDSRVMQSDKTLMCLQVHQYADNNIHIFMLKKSPVKNADGKITGICGFGSEITNPGFGRVLYNLLSLPQHDVDVAQNVEISDLYDELSSRETDVLFYFMRGYTNKDIAAYLQLSPRTVETYLERIKFKFRCHSRNELQDYCMHKGLIYFIPKNILGGCLNKSIAWW